MGTNALPDGFFGVIVPQGFQPDEPHFPRRPDSDIFPQLHRIALFLQIAQKMLKQECVGNTGVHIPAYLPIPCRLALLLGLLGVIAHGSALFRLLNDGQAVLPAKLVGGLPHEGVGTFAVVIFISVHE